MATTIKKLDNLTTSFFQTVIKLLPQYEEKIKSCQDLTDEINDHYEQLSVCKSVDVADLNSKLFNEALKSELLLKISDKINASMASLRSEVSWFRERASEISAKSIQCLDFASNNMSPKVLEDSCSSGKPCLPYVLDWVSRTASMFHLHSERCTLSLEHIPKKEVHEPEGGEVDDVDESDAIFNHSTSLINDLSGPSTVGEFMSKTKNQSNKSQFHFNHGDLDQIQGYCSAIITLPQSTQKPSTPSSQAKKKNK